METHDIEPLTYTPIGVIKSSFKEVSGMPIQPRDHQKSKAKVILHPEYVEGLKDLSLFSHVILIYHFHKSCGCRLTVTPFLDTQARGLFSTRAPSRPNNIGISVVALDRVQDNILYTKNIDVLDGTPLLDIKPYSPYFDQVENVKSGWLDQCEARPENHVADNRFEKMIGKN